MEERFTTRFASSEKEFLTQFGVNFGFTQVHSKVDRCYFLSSDAKALYHNLNQYAYNGSKECFPSQALLRAELGWSKNSVTKYVKELREKGLISTIRNTGRPLMYLIEELHKVPVIAHSEIVHEVRKELFGADEREVFTNALEVYKVSDEFKITSSVDNPLDYRELVYQWFVRFKGEPESQEVVEVIEEAPKPLAPRSRQVTVVNTEGVEKVGDPTKPEKGKKKGVSKNPGEAPVEDWNTNHFRTYFIRQYQNKYHNTYSWTEEDQKTMGRVVGSKEDNNTLKESIDRFFSIDQFSPKTVRLFGSTNTQAVLDEFSRTGKLPWYMTKDEEKPRLEEDSSGEQYDLFS